jgi:sugar lactone lactonase YvrE
MSNSLVLGTPVPIAGTAAELGESPVWNPVSQRLHWVDLMPGLLHETDPATGTTLTEQMEGPCGFVQLADVGLVVGVGTRVLLRGPDGLHPLAETDPRGGLRLNDSQVAPGGVLFAGLMHVDRAQRHESGRLVRVDGAGLVTVVTDGITVTNGMGWSPDATTMYHVDMPLKRVDAYDFDAATGTATGRRPAFELEVPGTPDGMAVDEEGRLWMALFGSPYVRCFTPWGKLVATVELPVANVTSCAFGGPDLSTLYVTTARREATAEQPHAGEVFAVETTARGQQPRAFITR